MSHNLPELSLAGSPFTTAEEFGIEPDDDWVAALTKTLGAKKRYEFLLDRIEKKHGSIVAHMLRPMFKAVAEMELRMRAETGMHKACSVKPGSPYTTCDLVYPLVWLNEAIEFIQTEVSGGKE